ncbi:MAG TPA: hypothetical protein VK712_03430 [Verrucomicrobiae bacterium]|jgi:hypothetical protein|nr:hypothetical protein [Verrucomicrobiae bacterium]
MAAQPEAGKALDTIQAAIHGAETHLEEQERVARYASSVLFEKGALVFAKGGHYGGTAGLLGSANPGMLLTRATIPVELQPQEQYVALRHNPEEGHMHDVQLLVLNSDKPTAVQQADGGEVVTTFANHRIHIPHVEVVEMSQIAAVESLVRLIDSSVEHEIDIRQGLPAISMYGRGRIADGQIFDLREEQLPII